MDNGIPIPSRISESVFINSIFSASLNVFQIKLSIHFVKNAFSTSAIKSASLSLLKIEIPIDEP